MQSNRSHVVLLHLGCLGDLVLAAPVCESVRSDHRTSVTLICRSEVAGVTNLFPKPPDRVIALDFDPSEWSEPTDELVTKVSAELEKIPHGNVDLFLSIERRPSWLAPIVAAQLGALESAYAPLERNTAWFARSMLRKLRLRSVIARALDVRPNEHETVRYARLAGESEPAPVQVWPIDKTAKREARTWLAASGFSFGRYIACFPVGAPSAPFEQFPPDRFADAFAEVSREFAFPVLIIGSADERREIEKLHTLLQKRGVTARIFLSDRDHFHLLAGILRGALAFVGNDTGLVHLAGALGIPGVTIFGGGTWPQYAPWAFGNIGLVAPLACFGCGWDCAFSFGLCVETIEGADVSRALRSLLVAKHTGASVETIERRTPEEKVIIERASATHRATQRDRADRQTTVLRLRDANMRRRKAVTQ